MTMLQRRCVLALAMLALPLAARAQTGAVSDPATPIQALNTALQAVMRAGNATPFPARMAMLQPAVAAAFDLPVILQNSVGPRWASLPESVRAELQQVFDRFTVATWVANFDADNGERFEILPDRRKVGNDVVVSTRIVPRAGTPTRLDYVMRNKAGTWKAVDILVDGAISRVAVQRSDFRGVLGAGDGSALVKMLRDKADALASGRA
jgi:phospholipid transport system substrate-binding protein